jgi:hypothetical protein
MLARNTPAIYGFPALFGFYCPPLKLLAVRSFKQHAAKCRKQAS